MITHWINTRNVLKNTHIPQAVIIIFHTELSVTLIKIIIG